MQKSNIRSRKSHAFTLIELLVVIAIIAILAAILLWFLLSFMFKPLGKLGHRLYQDAVDAINEDDENENKKE